MCKDSKSSKLLIDKPRKKQRSEEYLKYQRYIKSKTFKKIRDLVLERDEYRCAVCNSEESNKRHLTAHHKTYDHLYDEENHLDDLICLCHICHCAIHRAKSNWTIFRRKKDDTE